MVISVWTDENATEAVPALSKYQNLFKGRVDSREPTSVLFAERSLNMMMIGNVRIREVRPETFMRILQLLKLYKELRMRPAELIPHLREALVDGGYSGAEMRLLARTDKQLFTWFKNCFLLSRSKSGVKKLEEELHEARRNMTKVALSVAPLLMERGRSLRQTGPPVEQKQRGVEVEPEVERAHKKRRVAQLDVEELLTQDIENWQPSRLGQEATPSSRTSKKKLNSGEETE